MMLDVGENEHFRLVYLMKYQILGALPLFSLGALPLKKRGTQDWKIYSILCLCQSTASTSLVLANFNPLPLLTLVFFIPH